MSTTYVILTAVQVLSVIVITVVGWGNIPPFEQVLFLIGFIGWTVMTALESLRAVL